MVLVILGSLVPKPTPAVIQMSAATSTTPNDNYSEELEQSWPPTDPAETKTTDPPSAKERATEPPSAEEQAPTQAAQAAEAKNRRSPILSMEPAALETALPSSGEEPVAARPDNAAAGQELQAEQEPPPAHEPFNTPIKSKPSLLLLGARSPISSFE